MSELIPDRRFRPEPMTALEAIEWLSTHRYVWYKAPMDYNVTRLHFKPSAKLKLWKRDAERFSIACEFSIDGRYQTLHVDNGHLDRLRLPFDKWHHGITATVSHVDYVGQRHVIVLHQSNGYHLHMSSLSHAVNFAKRKAMQLKVRYGKRERILVPAHPPISGERNF